MARHIDVEIDEYKRISHPHSGSTDGIDTCIGIGLYDTEKRFAYIGHFSWRDTVEMNISAVMDPIKKALKTCSSPSNLIVKLAGNKALGLGQVDCIDDEEIYKLREDKDKVTSAILGVLLSSRIRECNIENRFGDVSMACYRIEADTRKGTIDLTGSSYFDEEFMVDLDDEL